MINLLNPEELKQIRAARLNVRLRRYLVLIVFIATGIAGIYSIGFWMASTERTIAQEQHATTEKQLEDYSDATAKAAAYRSNLAIAEKILGNEIVFSKFLTDTASVLPSNTILSNLTLSTKTVASSGKKPGSMVLSARTKSYDDALRMKESLEASSLFSDVRLSQTSVQDKIPTSGIESIYPFEATYDIVIDQMSGAPR